MSERRDLAAYTAPGSNAPAFINLSRVDDDIVVTVRGAVTGTMAYGPMADIRLSKRDFGRLVGELLERNL